MISISVVIPTFNREKYIRKAVDSVPLLLPFAASSAKPAFTVT